MPDEPTTTELNAILEYIFSKTDPYVTFKSNGPFIMALGMSFVISAEGDKFTGPVTQLTHPIVMLDEHNVDEVLDTLGYAERTNSSYTVN